MVGGLDSGCPDRTHLPVEGRAAGPCQSEGVSPLLRTTSLGGREPSGGAGVRSGICLRRRPAGVSVGTSWLNAANLGDKTDDAGRVVSVSLVLLLQSSTQRSSLVDVLSIAALALLVVVAVVSILGGRRSGGVTIDFAADENAVDESTVRTNLLLAWLQTNLILTTKRLAGTVPNTVMFVFPFGRRDVTQPLSRISNVSFDSRFDVVRFILGAGALYLAFGTDITTLGQVVLVVIALLFLSYSYTAAIEVADNSGKTQRIPVSVIDRAEIERFVGVVNRQLAEEPILPPRAQPQPPAPTLSAGDRIERLSQLADLRNQGVLSEAEFEAEKGKLLNS